MPSLSCSMQEVHHYFVITVHEPWPFAPLPFLLKQKVLLHRRKIMHNYFISIILFHDIIYFYIIIRNPITPYTLWKHHFVTPCLCTGWYHSFGIIFHIYNNIYIAVTLFAILLQIKTFREFRNKNSNYFIKIQRICACMCIKTTADGAKLRAKLSLI